MKDRPTSLVNLAYLLIRIPNTHWLAADDTFV